MQQQQTITEIPQDTYFYDHLKCVVCLETAVQAAESSCCHNIYCESCLTRSKTQNNLCPSCRQQNFEVLPSHLGRRLIKMIPTQCPWKCNAKLTIGDLESHKKNCPNKHYKCPEVGCEDFEGDHGVYTQHIISKHADIIVPAVEAMRTNNKFTRSGTIGGFYMQYNHQHGIEGTFRMENGQVYVNTHDEVGPAGWKGEIEKNDLSITLLKSYHGSHIIFYKGKFNKELTKLTGRWGWDHSADQEGFELNFTVKDN